MLYRLLKNVNQSLSTFLWSSDRSCQSGLQSSGFREDCASALDASLPANTRLNVIRAAMRGEDKEYVDTFVRAFRAVHLVVADIEDSTLDSQYTEDNNKLRSSISHTLMATYVG